MTASARGAWRLAPDGTPRAAVVLADPPWEFRVDNRSGVGRTAATHYRTAGLDWIKSLDGWVSDHTLPTCALFLWAPSSQLREALDVARAWGFGYRTLAFVWVKLGSELKPGDTGTAVEGPHGRRRLHFGMGHYTRGGAEVCLLATRGRVPVIDRGVRQVIHAPVREHSRKPDECYTAIEALYPGVERLELFARARRPGWHAVGDELGKFGVVPVDE